MTEPRPRRPWWQAPIAHFLIIGACLFSIDALSTEPAPEPTRITVDRHTVDALSARITAATGAEPTPKALRAAIDAHTQDEMLFREALRLGLDQHDTIVKRRLIQKMTFVLEQLAEVPEPTEADLEAQLQRKPKRYQTPERTTFEHAFFSAQSRPDTALTDAHDARSLLQKNPDLRLGDPFALGHTFERRTQKNIADKLGPDIAKALSSLPIGAWSAPTRSPYGHHLLRVRTRTPAADPSLDAPTVRAKVREDWLTQAKAKAIDKARATLQKHYDVQIEGDAP